MSLTKGNQSQALPNFIVECLIPNEPRVEDTKSWMLYVNGLTTNGGSGLGLIVVSPKGHTYEHALNYFFRHPTMKLSMKPYWPS